MTALEDITPAVFYLQDFQKDDNHMESSYKQT